MYDFLLPVIQLSTDTTKEPYVYMGEDGLELWQATLHSAPTMTSGLLDLYNNMPQLLGKLGRVVQLHAELQILGVCLRQISINYRFLWLPETTNIYQY